MTIWQKITLLAGLAVFVLWTFLFMDQLDLCRNVFGNISCGGQPLVANLLQYFLLQLATTGIIFFIALVILKKKK